MELKVVNFSKNEETLLEYIRHYYPDLKLSQSDIDRFVRKCIRDKNFTILKDVTISFKISASMLLVEYIRSLKFEVFLLPVNDFSFSLPSKWDKNDKIHNLLSVIFKKVSQAIKDNPEIGKEENLKYFVPSSVTVDFCMNENIMSWFRFINHRKFIDCSSEYKDLANMIYRELSLVLPSVVNDKNLELYFMYHPKMG